MTTTSAASVPPADQASRLRALAAQRPASPTDARREPSRRGGRRGAVVTICSGKGGVGKTTFAVNAAVILARLGVRTVLVDLDIGVANADLLLGVTPRVRLGRPALAAGRFAETAVRLDKNLALVAGIAGGGSAARLTSDELDGALVGLDRLRAHADLVLVDTGAGVGVESVTLAATADLAVYVTTPEPASIADVYAAHKCVTVSCGGRGPASGLIVNAALDKRDAERTAERLDATSRRFLEVPLPQTGWVRRDKRMARAGRARVPVAVNTPFCRVSRDLDRCARAMWAGCAGLCAEDRAGPAKVAASTGR